MLGPERKAMKQRMIDQRKEKLAMDLERHRTERKDKMDRSLTKIK